MQKENVSKKKSIKGIIRAVIASAVCLLMPFTALSASAASNEFPDLEREGSISITFTYYDENTEKTYPISNGNSVGLYKVADVVVDDGFKFVADSRFSKVGEIPETDQELESVNIELAEKMAAIAKNYEFDVEPKKMDADGKVSFSGLSIGLYLVLQAEKGEGSNKYSIAPFLMTIPNRNPDGTLNYNVNAAAKPIGVAREYVPPKRPNRKLPQTGQMWWPVAALAAAGTAFVLFGALRKRRG